MNFLIKAMDFTACKSVRLLLALWCLIFSQYGCVPKQIQKTNVPPPPKVISQQEAPGGHPQAHNPTTPVTPSAPPKPTHSTTNPTLPPPARDPATTAPSLPHQTLPATIDTATAQQQQPATSADKEAVLPALGQMDIALLLPFNMPVYHEGMNVDSLPEKTKVALDFYEGILCGLDYLRTQGIVPNIKVLDSENNPAKVRGILADPALSSETDLIIGPIYNGEIKDVATFAKQNKIYQVSPLSPSTQNTKDNPYYIMANPSVETHCKAMFDYISTNMLNSQIIAVSSNAKPSDQALAAKFGQFATAKKSEGMNGYPVSSLNFNAGITSSAELEALMSPSRRNVFVVTTYNDEALIIDISNKLLSLSEKYDIAVFGMPNWVDLPNLPLDALAELNFHYTTTYWDNQSAEIQYFKQSFYNKFKTYPSEYAGRAYDLIRYFGQSLKNNGRQVGDNLNDKTGLFGNFKFRPSIGGVKTDYIENNYVHIIRFNQEYILERINR